MNCRLTVLRNNEWHAEGMQIVQIVAPSSLQFCVKTSISKATEDDSLQGVYKLSNRWVIVSPTVQTNSTMSVVKCILI